MKIFKEKDIKTEFLPSALEIIETPPSPLGKLTIWLIFSLIVIAVVWSIIGSVDKVAIMRGRVVPAGRTKVIQSLESGIITKIHVQEGQKVQKGDLLIELDTYINTEELKKLEDALNVARLERQLFLAALNGDQEKVEKIIAKNEELKINPAVIRRQVKYKNLIEEEYKEKQETYQIQFEKAKKEYTMMQKELEKIEEKIEILQKQTAKQKKLYEGGVISRKQYQEKEDDLRLSKLDRDIQLRKIASYEEQLTLSKSQPGIYALDYDKQLMKQIVEKDKSIQQLKKEAAQLKKKIERQQIKSPVKGTVHEIQANTIGGVIASAKPILTIVPADANLLVEAMARNKDIGFIEKGDKVDIKLDTFPFQKYGTLKGKIVHISPTAEINEKLGYVYKILVEPEKETIFVDTRDIRISPGMTVTAEAQTGKRKIIEFFIPAIDYIKDSFKLR